MFLKLSFLFFIRCCFLRLLFSVRCCFYGWQVVLCVLVSFCWRHETSGCSEESCIVQCPTTGIPQLGKGSLWSPPQLFLGRNLASGYCSVLPLVLFCCVGLKCKMKETSAFTIDHYSYVNYVTLLSIVIKCRMLVTLKLC